MAFSSSPLATAYPWLHRLPPRAPEEASWRHAGGCAGAWVQSGSGPPASTLSGSSSCRVQKLVAHRTLPGRAVHRGKFLEVPWLAFPASSSCRGLVSSRQDPLAGALYLSSLAGQDAPCREGSLSLACRCSACRRRWILFSVIAYSRGPCPAVSVALVFTTPILHSLYYLANLSNNTYKVLLVSYLF